MGVDSGVTWITWGSQGAASEHSGIKKLKGAGGLKDASRQLNNRGISAGPGLCAAHTDRGFSAGGGAVLGEDSDRIGEDSS